jgi:hypothetical protein
MTNADRSGNQANKRERRCFFCDEKECAGIRYKQNCPKIKAYLDNGSVSVSNRGRLVDRNGKELELNVGYGGIQKRVDASASAINHIEYSGDIAEVPAVGGIFLNELTSEGDFEVRAILDKIADLGLESEATKLWNVLQDETRPKKRLRAWEGSMGAGRVDPQPAPVTVLEKPRRATPNYEERDRDVDDINRQIMDSSINVSVKKLLSVSPALKAKVSTSARGRKQPTAEVHQLSEDLWREETETGDFEEQLRHPVGNSKTARIPVTANGIGLTAHYDAGSEISVMTLETCKRIGVAVEVTKKDHAMIGAGGQRNEFAGQAVVRIGFGPIEVPVRIYVVKADSVSYSLLLGKPYGRAVRMVESTNLNGTTDLLATHPDGTRTVRYRHVPGGEVEPRSNNSNALFEVRHLEEATTSVDCFELNKALSNYFTVLKTKYKPVATKVRPQRKPLEDGSQPYEWRTQEAESLVDRQLLVNGIMEGARLAGRSRVTPDRLAEMRIARRSSLNEKEKGLLEAVVIMHEAAFSFDVSEIGLIRDEVVPPYQIRTVKHEPMQVRRFPLARSMEGEIRGLLAGQLEAGMVEPSHGGYSINWFCSRKSSGGLRLIHDMQPVNAVTIRDACVPPDMEDILEAASGQPLYCVLDAHSGYDQRNLDVRSRDLTGFQTPMGLLRKTRSPQGATNSVADFQRAMVKVFGRELLKGSVSVYIDDVIVYTRGLVLKGPPVEGIRDEVLLLAANLSETLESAIVAGLTFSGSKAYVGVEKAVIVGHEVGGAGRTPAEKNVLKVRNWNKFKDKTGVRGFVQMAGFFRAYLRDFATMAEPLFRLLRKKAEFVWTQEQRDSVEAIKDALTSQPVIRPIDYASHLVRPLIISTDAGPEAGGGFLGQDDENGDRRVNRYMSFTFTPAVRNYGQFKRELYAMVKNVKLVRYKVYGCNLVIETDCLPLIGFLNNPDLIDPAMVRWIAYLQLFNATYRHVKGKDNVVSDGLSRKARDDPTSSDEEDLLEGDLGMPYVLSVARTTVEDWRKVYTGEWGDLVEYLVTLKRPVGLSNAKWNNFKKWAYQFMFNSGVLYRRSGKDRIPRRVLVTSEQKKKVLESLHDDSGHKDVVIVYKLVSERYYWKGMYKDVKIYCDTCHECQARSRQRMNEPIRPWAPRTLDAIWFVDVVNMTEEEGGYKYVIMAREGLSNWLEAARLKRKRSIDWIKFVDREIVTRYGCTTIVSDHGELDSRAMQDYCRQRGVIFLPVAEYNPRANVVERGHKPFVDGLAKACLKLRASWADDYLFNSALWADRITVKRGTGYSPYFLRFGQDCVLPIEYILPTWAVAELLENEVGTSDLLAIRTTQIAAHRYVLENGFVSMMDMKTKNAKYVAKIKRLRKEELKEGDLVLLENTKVRLGLDRKLDPFWLGPYKVTKVIGNGTYIVSELDGSSFKEPITGNRLMNYKLREDYDVTERKYYEYFRSPKVDNEEDSDNGDAISGDESSGDEDSDYKEEEEIVEWKNTKRGLDGSYWSKPGRK